MIALRPGPVEITLYLRWPRYTKHTTLAKYALRFLGTDRSLHCFCRTCHHADGTARIVYFMLVALTSLLVSGKRTRVQTLNRQSPVVEDPSILPIFWMYPEESMRWLLPARCITAHDLWRWVRCGGSALQPWERERFLSRHILLT